MNKQWWIAVAAVGLVACGSETKELPANNESSNNVDQNNVSVNNGSENNTSANNGSTNNVSENNTPSSLTYYADIKPIIDAKCAGCHVEGGIGPFPLTSFDEVTAVSGLVAAAVQNDEMPPYIYDQECRDYVHNPELSVEQTEAITEWVDAGSAEGDPENEGAPIVADLPDAPQLDTTLQMPTAYTPVQSPDDYRCFVVDWPHDTEKFITGFGVEPGDPETVHHVIAFLAGPDQVAEAEQLDAAEEGPGYTCFGGPGLANQQGIGWLGSWAPGGVPARYPAGTGIGVDPGSKVIIQVHYNTLIVEPRPDQTTVMVQTADNVEKEALWLPWANPTWLNGSMKIPAGEADVMHQFEFDPTQFISNGQGVDIWAAGLHQHLLGTSIRASIKHQDGNETCLADAPVWDFNWQTGVDFQEPARLSPGDRLRLECHWDNSMTNQPVVDGQRVTPGDRNWGEGTLDEMCLGLFYVTVAD